MSNSVWAGTAPICCLHSWPLQTAEEEAVSYHIPQVTEVDWSRGWSVQAHRAPAGTFEDLEVAPGALGVLNDLLLKALCAARGGCWLLPMAGTTRPLPSASHGSAAGAGCLLGVTSKATEHHAVQLFIQVSPSDPDEGQGGRAEPGSRVAQGRGARTGAGSTGRAWPGDAVLGGERGATSRPCPARPGFSAWLCHQGGACHPYVPQLCWREAQHQPISMWWALVWNPPLLSVLGKSNYGYFMVPRRGPRVSLKAHLSFWKEHLIT